MAVKTTKGRIVVEDVDVEVSVDNPVTEEETVSTDETKTTDDQITSETEETVEESDENDVSVQSMDDTDKVAKKADYRPRIRYDYDTGFVLLRVSASTEPRKLGGAITKHFRDGARALIISYIGLNTLSVAIKGICAAQEYLPKENSKRLEGKKLAIVPEFHTFSNDDNGQISTQKLTLYLVDELK